MLVQCQVVDILVRASFKESMVRYKTIGREDVELERMTSFNEHHLFDHKGLPLLGVELKIKGYETGKNLAQIFLRLCCTTGEPGRERCRSSSWDL